MNADPGMDQAILETKERLERIRQSLIVPAEEKPRLEVKLLQGDALETLKTLPGQSVDLVFTNPPVEYHVSSQGRTDRVVFNTDWIREAMRVCRGPIAYTIHADAFLWLWRAKDESIWSLPPESVSAWVVNQPGVFHGIDAMTWNMLCLHRVPLRDKRIRDVIVAPVGDDNWEPAQDHPAPGSFHLAFQLIQALGAKSVLDPFCGVGVTLHAGEIAGATELIGIDRSQAHLNRCADEFARRGATVTEAE